MKKEIIICLLSLGMLTSCGSEVALTIRDQKVTTEVTISAGKTVADALDAAGIAYDRQKFVPHITLVRKAAGSWKQVAAPKGEMTVTKISLMKSAEKNGKMVYTEL